MDSLYLQPEGRGVKCWWNGLPGSCVIVSTLQIRDEATHLENLGEGTPMGLLAK